MVNGVVGVIYIYLVFTIAYCNDVPGISEKTMIKYFCGVSVSVTKLA